MAKEVKNSRSGELKNTAEDLDEFMNKVKYFFVTSLLAFLSSVFFCSWQISNYKTKELLFLLFPLPFLSNYYKCKCSYDSISKIK